MHMFSILCEDSFVEQLAKLRLSWDLSVHGLGYIRLHVGTGICRRKGNGSVWFVKVLAETIKIFILCIGVKSLPLAISMCIHE